MKRWMFYYFQNKQVFYKGGKQHASETNKFLFFLMTNIFVSRHLIDLESDIKQAITFSII